MDTNTGCPTCSQDTLNACKIKSITGPAKAINNPYIPALFLHYAPFNDLSVFSYLSTAGQQKLLLPAPIFISQMNNLKTLTGLESIGSIIPREIAGVDAKGTETAIRIQNNPNLTSAVDLSNAGSFNSKSLFIYDNGQKFCVPDHWPNVDQTGNTIRQDCPAPSPPSPPSTSCKASDPALGLTIVDSMHVVTTNAQLDKVCKCKSINYLFIGLEEPAPFGRAGCADCQQETLDACQLESITGNWQTGANDGMLYIQGPMPHITSLRGLARLSGNLGGGLGVENMDSLTTLDGLEGITSITVSPNGQPGYCYSCAISLGKNPNLISAMALKNATINPYPKDKKVSDMLYIGGNPSKLACVPEKWPVKDMNENTMRHGSCPSLYSCTSSGKCQQSPTGTMIKSDCTNKCKKHGTHHVGQGDHCGKISVEECGVGTPCTSFADCPAICNSATVCPGLQVGDDAKFDCSLKGTFC